MEKFDLFVCECGLMTHQLVLSTVDNDEERVVYGSFFLDNYGLLRRVTCAFKYILGFDRKDGDFDCLLLRKEDLSRIRRYAEYLSPSVDEPTTNISFESDEIRYVVNICNDGLDTEIAIMPFMRDGNLFQRISRGMKHIFGHKSNYGEFDHFELTETDSVIFYGNYLRVVQKRSI